MVSTEVTQCIGMKANDDNRACRLAQGEASRKSSMPQWHQFWFQWHCELTIE